MKLARIILALVLPAFILIGFAPGAQALPGESAVDPYIVTDPSLVPDTADMLVEGCKTIYTWDIYTPEKTDYYMFVDMTVCEVQIQPKITLVDRCGWRRDNVRVKFDDRLESVRVRQVTKTTWRIKMVAREGYVVVKPFREYHTRYSFVMFVLKGKTC